MSGLRFATLLVALLVGAAALAATPMTPHIVMINDRQMISLQDFAETFDADVDYHVDRNEICITLFDTTVYVVPYRMTAWVNDRKVWLDMPVVIVDDITYLPVKFLCDAFGFRYEWRQPTRDVCIVNRWTLETIVIVIDIDWHRHHHVWRHDYDWRWYVNFHKHHKVDWGRRDAHPPHGGQGHHPYNDKDRPGGWSGGHHDAGGGHHGGYGGGHGGYGDRPHDGKPDFRPDNDRRDHDVHPVKPPVPVTGPIGNPRPYGDQRPDFGKPNPGVQHGGNWPQPGQPDGKDNAPWWRRDGQPDSKDNGPTWKRDERPSGALPSIYEWLNKRFEIKPNNGGYAPAQNDRPQPGYNHQDKGQDRDNGRHEKERKDDNRKEKSSDNGDKGNKGKGHRDK